VNAVSAVVVGANGGIGAALLRELVRRNAFSHIFGVARQAFSADGVDSVVVDGYHDKALAAAAKEISARGETTLCLCATGLLSGGRSGRLKPEKSYKQQTVEAFEETFFVNTIVPALVAKHFLPIMPRQQRAVFAALSARVGSISDNGLGGWHAYRASKTALNMLIKNYAIEQAFSAKQFIAVGLHPGTVDTSLSKPFQKGVPADKLFDADRSAGYLLDVVDGLTPKDSGMVFDWAGKKVPA